jgi:Cft2 family RNA processing exonuclease
MSTGVAVSPISKSWRELYKAALFETDKNRMSERIAYAEWALALRARELFHTGREHLQERQAVDAAIYALHVLRRTTACAAGRNAKDGGEAA